MIKSDLNDPRSEGAGEEGNLGSAEVGSEGSEGSLDSAGCGNCGPMWKLWTELHGARALARGKITPLHTPWVTVPQQLVCTRTQEGNVQGNVCFLFFLDSFLIRNPLLVPQRGHLQKDTNLGKMYSFHSIMEMCMHFM